MAYSLIDFVLSILQDCIFEYANIGQGLQVEFLILLGILPFLLFVIFIEKGLKVDNIGDFDAFKTLILISYGLLIHVLSATIHVQSDFSIDLAIELNDFLTQFFILIEIASHSQRIIELVLDVLVWLKCTSFPQNVTIDGD